MYADHGVTVNSIWTICHFCSLHSVYLCVWVCCLWNCIWDSEVFGCFRFSVGITVARPLKLRRPKTCVFEWNERKHFLCSMRQDIFKFRRFMKNRCIVLWQSRVFFSRFHHRLWLPPIPGANCDLKQYNRSSNSFRWSAIEATGKLIFNPINNS